MANVKCKICGISFDREKEPFVKTGKRYIHLACAESNKEYVKESDDLNALHKYLMNLLKNDYSFIKIQRQVEMYQEEYKYTTKGMYYTLKYFYEVKNNPLDKANGGIGIVPHVYIEAGNYYKKLGSKIKNVKGSMGNLTNKEAETIRIKNPKRKNKRLKSFFDRRVNEE